jgi:cytidylate kinase
MVITLSRQTECGGEEIAQRVVEELGLEIADRVIVEHIAKREGLPTAHLAVYDDAAPGAIEAVIAEWQTSVSHVSYVRRLVHTLLTLEREGGFLIMGRGAAFVLTDPGTLHVRAVAPMPCRVARLIQRGGLARSAAERMLRRSDEARARFVRQAFDADIEAACHYDLVINTAELSAEEAGEIVALGAQRKAARRALAAERPEDLVSQVLGLRRRPRFPRVSEIVWRHCEGRRYESGRSRGLSVSG